MGTVDSQQDFLEIPLLKIVPEQLTADPTTTVTGRFWTRTDLNTIKVWLAGVAKTLATTDDSRFTDSRPPNGAAGGDLAGTYPNPTIGSQKVTLAHHAFALLQNGVSSGTAAVGDLALRKLGYTTHDAMPGNARLDQIAAPTAQVSMNSQKIVGLANGTAATDAINKGQLDAAIQGYGWKDSVKYASTISIGGISAAGATIAAASVPTYFDGAAIGDVPVGTRLLVRQENVPSGSDPKWNGIYEVLTNNGTQITIDRASDADVWGELDGAAVFVEAGATLESTGWVADADAGGTLDTTAISWTQFTGAGQIVAGDGLSKTGNQLDVNLDPAGALELNVDMIRVKALGITNAMLAGAIDLAAKVTGLLPIANGGTGANSASGARANLVVPGYYNGLSPAMATPGTWYDVVHNLGAEARSVRVRVASTGQEVTLDNRDKAGAVTTTIQIKHDVTGGRAASYYEIDVLA